MRITRSTRRRRLLPVALATVACVALATPGGAGARDMPVMRARGGGGDTATARGAFTLDSLRPARFVLRVPGTRARLIVPWPVYRFACADIDGDGRVEACLGVVKPTRLDPVARRRLFVYRHARGAIRPAWLGSRLGTGLADFHLATRDGRAVVRALERDPRTGRYAVGVWQWQSFGFRLIGYEGTAMRRHAAFSLFHHHGVQ